MGSAWNLILSRTKSLILGADVTPMICSVASATARVTDKRTAPRRSIALPTRLTWKDARGMMRFATGVTRNVSDFGMYVECHTPVSIPLYRIVHVQIDRDGLASAAVPPTLLRGRVLSAVYRVSQASMSQRQGFALRLMIDPRSMAATEQARATA
jgi:hypothetical protein